MINFVRGVLSHPVFPVCAVYAFMTWGIIEATNGQLAIDMYKEHKPNLTFIDIVMPVKDGNAAISEIMEYDSSATIFVASSVGTQSELKKALAAGACDFIQKPIDKDQVISLIKKHIGGN